MTKPEMPYIRGDEVLLRPLREEDLPMTLAWRNDDAIRRWFLTTDRIDSQRHREWFEHYLTKDNDFTFIIEETAVLKKAVGQIALYNIDWGTGRGEFGRLMIGESAARGKGLAKEATNLLVNFAETQLGLQETYLDVYVDNQPAIAVYSACGFRWKETTLGVARMVRMRISAVTS